MTHAAPGIVAYVPITLTNNQGLATPSPFQQKITWNPSSYTTYEASDLGNIRFCADGACTTTLFAWLESCTSSCAPSATSASAWVKLTSSIAAGGGTLTIYMIFLSTAALFDGNYWGEAPTIPATYGTNDNGANVFTFYDNFAGTSLSPKWTTVSSSGGGGSSIALDATSNSASGLGSVSSYSWTHTVGTGLSNSILIVGVTVEKSSGFDATSVTYNSVSLAKKVGVGTGTSQLKASVWYLLNPPSGAHTVLVTLSGAVGTDGAAGGAISLSGVDQTTPMPTTNSAFNTNAAAPTVSLTTANANSWTVDAMAFDSATVQSATGSGQTRRWGVAASGMSGQGSTIVTTTAGSYTMSWSGSDKFSTVVAEVKPAGGSPTCTVAVNNGATFTTSTSSAWCFVAASPIAYPSVAESYMVSAGTNTDPMMGVATSISANSQVALANGYEVDNNRASGTLYLSAETSSGGTSVTSKTESFVAGIWQMIWSATGAESASDSSVALTGTSATPSIASYGIYIGQSTQAAGNDVVDWGRMRGYPPGGVTPIAVFGSLAIASTTTTTSTTSTSSTTSTTSTTTTSSTTSSTTITSSTSTSSTTSKATSTTTSSSTTTTTGTSTTSALTSTSSQTRATSTTASIASTSTKSSTTAGGSLPRVLGQDPLLLGGVALVGGAVVVAVIFLRRRPHKLLPS